MLLVGSGLVGLGFFKRSRKREVLSWEIYGEGKKMVYWLKMGIWTLNIAFIVILATNSIEGVKKAIQEKPDLILMDILMPKMDGRDATRIIRTNRETRDIPILATTVINWKPDLRSCLDAGCNNIITKPFILQNIQGKILEFIPSA